MNLLLVKLSYAFCQTKLKGEFTTRKFCQLLAKQREFIEIFIKCRGNIKDVKKELRISYPTVGNRLNSAIEALRYRLCGKLFGERWKKEKLPQKKSPGNYGAMENIKRRRVHTINEEKLKILKMIQDGNPNATEGPDKIYGLTH